MCFHEHGNKIFDSETNCSLCGIVMRRIFRIEILAISPIESTDIL